MHRFNGTVRAVVALALCFSASSFAAPLVAWADESASATVSPDTTTADFEASVAATPTATVLKLSAPSRISARAKATITASLATTAGAPVVGRYVIIERIADPAVVLGRGKTDSAGRYRVTIAPTSKVTVRARFLGDSAYGSAMSPTAYVAPKVKMSAPWTHSKIAYPGQRLPARGTLWPKHSSKSKATTIVAERYEGGKWVKRATFKAKIVNSKSGSRYEAVIKLPKSGTWRVRAKHADSGHATTWSASTKIKVSDWRKRYRGKKVGGIKTSKKMVAITIDDGPNKRTLEVCSILERYGGKGTFFFTRQLINRGYSGQVKKAYNRGHEIANHTANHKMLTGSYAHSYKQAYTPMATIRKATGFSPTWIRAMGGGIDKTGMKAVVKTGQLYANWSIDSYDSHRRYTPPSTLYRNVMRGVKPGSVILIHQTHPETIKALPRICKELKRRGYKMVTLSELAASGKPRGY